MWRIYMFQFHKVRLKESRHGNRVAYPQTFQFHKVRLKDKTDLAQLLCNTTFQFHKVRLKGRGLAADDNYVFAVSIP